MDERFNTLAKRIQHTAHTWRTKGAARMDWDLWLCWALLGRYPREAKSKI